MLSNDVEKLKLKYKNYLIKEGTYSESNYINGVKKIEMGIPLQYVIGNVDFYGNRIFVDNRVLIPRFETEELVNYTYKLIKKHFNENVNIIDLGTGSGCIAISIKKLLPKANVSGKDISSEAIELAKENAVYNNVDIDFEIGNMINVIDGKYDVLISNPPYIAYDEEIDEIVKNNEPSLALYAKNNGLYFYEEILKNCSNYLSEKSLIAFEIGYKQKNEIVKLIKKYFENSTIITKKDMVSKDRFIFILNNLNKKDGTHS